MELRPTCEKCEDRHAMCRMEGMWICGQCIHEFKMRLVAKNKKAFLEG